MRGKLKDGLKVRHPHTMLHIEPDGDPDGGFAYDEKSLFFAGLVRDGDLIPFAAGEGAVLKTTKKA